jgi:hypothetical protein
MRNIENLLAIANTDRNDMNSRVMNPSELNTSFQFSNFTGTNTYYGINDSNLAQWQNGGDPLSAYDRSIFQGVVDAVNNGSLPSAVVNVGLEPGQGFDFANANLPLVSALATALGALQTAASNKVQFVIRYASEMNDHAHASAYAGQPEAYKTSYAAVRATFDHVAPDIKFTFSPAIRADLSGSFMSPDSFLDAYYPATSKVDGISCTWYIGNDNDAAASTNFFIKYMLHRSGFNLYGIDEIGGVSENDGVSGQLSRMCSSVFGLPMLFDYVTVFLMSKWRPADDNLSFLSTIGTS